MQKIKTYEEACNKLGIKPLKRMPNGLAKELGMNRKDVKTYKTVHKLNVIAEAINDGETIDFSDHNRMKFYPCISGVTVVAPLPVFSTQEAATYMAENFGYLYAELLM